MKKLLTLLTLTLLLWSDQSQAQCPIITKRPESLAVACDGANASFTVVTSGPTATYQWYALDQTLYQWYPLSNGGFYSGVTSPTLTITGVNTLPPPAGPESYYTVAVYGGSGCRTDS